MKCTLYFYAISLCLFASCETQNADFRILHRICETAAAFANHTCDSLFNTKPFATEYYLTFRDSLLVWSQNRSKNDSSFYAKVTFNSSGALVETSIEARKILRGPIEAILRDLQL